MLTFASGQAPTSNPPSFEDPRIHAIVAAASPERVERDIRTLVGFGTRHTMSDTLSPTRGIGAARRWIFDEFRRISVACGGCLVPVLYFLRFFTRAELAGVRTLPRQTG